MKAAHWTLYGCYLLVVATTLLALLVGPTLDDYIHPTLLDEGGPLSLYDFLGPEDVARHRHIGNLPWWTSPELSMRFFRPLSSLDLALDHALLDAGGILSHLHGLLWYGALLTLVYQLYCALFDRRVARFATPLYALAGWHTMSLAFVAARHALVTAVFAVWSLQVLVQRQNAAPQRAWLAALPFLVALLAGESALLVVPLMLGFGVVRFGWAGAVRRLAPILAAALLYGIAYAAAGLGARGSALYLEPLSWQFVVELPPRWLALVADAFGSLAADATLLGARPVQLVWGLIALGLVALVLRWQLDRDHERGRLLVGLVCGSLIAMIPASAAMPGGRALLVVGLAASALFGSALAALADGGLSRRLPSACLLGWVWLFGVGLHPVFRAILSWDLRRLGTDVVSFADELSHRCSDRVVLAAGALDMNIGVAGHVLARSQRPAPRAVHLLSMAPGRHTLTRTSDAEFELTVEGDFYASMWSRNHSNEPLRPGMRARLRGLDVRLLETEPSTRLRLVLADGADPCWVTSGEGGLTLMNVDSPRSSWTPVVPR